VLHLLLLRLLLTLLK